eukprot:2795615-Rhodomonas_salina.1
MYQGKAYCAGERGHTCAYLCRRCWLRILKKKKSEQRCPFCRSGLRAPQRLPEQREPRFGLADSTP